MISHSGRKRAATKTRTTPAPIEDHDYDNLLVATHQTFARVSGKFFVTDVDDLWGLYLKGLPANQRQFHNCHCCRKFIETYGSLVAIDERGDLTPAMWSPDVPDLYGPSFAAMWNRVKHASVTGMFLSKQSTWGAPRTGEWSHLSVFPPASAIYVERLLTPGQAMAAKRQDFITVKTALADVSSAMLDEAIRILSADALARSERFLGPVKWLRALQDRPKGKQGDAIVWRAIAAAPDGYCHPRASVIWPLLDDIKAGKPFAEIKRAFDAMLHPLRYQRPQAAPAAGNIRAAEEAVEKLGFARSLERRFARLDEVQKVWAPPDPAPSPTGGVFAHLRPALKGAVRPVDLPAQTMTVQKFVRGVLPTAEKIEFYAPGHGNYMAMLTAEHADAPMIMKWGNPFSIYVYVGGSRASDWSVVASAWTQVTALVRTPCMWGDNPQPHLGDGLMLVLNGAVDRKTESGNALFPETLVGDLYAYRSVVEAYSKTAAIGGRDQASVCGYGVTARGQTDALLRVLSAGAWAGYRLDRWD